MQKEFDVDDRSPAVERMAESWPMIDALVGGTLAMRKAGGAFMPQWPKEDAASYKSRLSVATLFPAFTRTTSVLAAKPFSKPLAIGDGLPDQVMGWMDDVDRQETTLHAFAAGLMLHCMRHGLCGVLVEYPPVPEAATIADELASGARPYFAAYQPGCILGWKMDGTRLAQLRLTEMVVEPDGEFGEVEVCQVRVLYPGRWQVWRKVKDPNSIKEEWRIFEEGATTLNKIPFVFFYGLKECFGVGNPPLLDLAYQNVEHWQSASDQQTILHVARVPILLATGFDDDKELTVGANAAVQASNPDAKLQYVEHSGAAISAGRQAVLDIEDRMRQTGAELLVQRPSTTTATQTVSEESGNRSTLQRIVETFEESLEECVELMGEWVGLDFEAEITLFKDFGATNLSDQSSNVLLSAASIGAVSNQTIFEQLQRRDIISQDLKWEDEAVKLKQQPKMDGIIA